MQEQGGCLVFCPTKRQCEISAQALCRAAAGRGAAAVTPAQQAARLQLAMDLLAAQGGDMLSPLRDVLLSCTGVAYHHAGALSRAVML